MDQNIRVVATRKHEMYGCTSVLGLHSDQFQSAHIRRMVAAPVSHAEAPQIWIYQCGGVRGAERAPRKPHDSWVYASGKYIAGAWVR
jgi:hypothetical protein